MYKGTEVSRDRAHSIWRTECSLAKLVCCLSAGVGQEEQKDEAEKMVWGRLGRALLAILWNSSFRKVYLSFSHLPLASFLSYL